MTERIVRWLLRLYPREFRDAFGGEMLATARALDRRPGRRPGRFATIADAASAAVAIRAEMRAERRVPPSSTRWKPMSVLTRDAAMAVRRLRREPLFVLFVAGTLALAIGANATLFGLADRLILRGPDHVRDADRVLRVYMSAQLPGRPVFTTSGLGYVSFDLIRGRMTTAADAAAYAINDGTTGRGPDAVEARLGYVSPGFFSLLGVRPSLGQFFADEPDAGAIVISHEVWRRGFAGARDVLGRSAVVNDEPYTIAGVAPPGFTGADLGRVDFWLPLEVLSRRITADWRTSWNAQWLEVIVRLRDGVTFEQADAELTAVHRAAYTGDDEIAARATMRVAPLLTDSAASERLEARVVRWLAGVAGIVLVIACANVTSLLLARGARRTREVGIQVALGASRAAVVRAHLVETMMLAAAGGVGALAITHVLGGLARRALLADIEWTASSVSPRVVAATAVIVVGVSLAVGLLPALGVSRTSPVTAMRQGARDGGGRRRGLRSGLTIVQAALSVLLLVGAGLFVRSLWNAQSLDLGIDTDRVLVVEVSRPALSRIPEGAARDAERTRRRLFFLDVLERVEALPGVERAGVAVGLPFGNRFSMPVRVPGIDELPRVNGTGPGVSAVSDDYFATIGTPILEGRAFTRADRAGAAPVSIVSEVMARTVWPGRSPIGECVIVGAAPACATIVGVAGNTHRSRLQETPYMHIYLPHGQEQGFGGAVLLVRAERPGDLAESVRRVLAASDSSVTFVRAEVLQARIDPQLQSWRLGSAVFVWSGVLALLVAAVGIYSVLSYLVADRHHEIGVRLALGARAVQVTRLVVGPGLGLSAAGVAAGLCLAALLAPLVEPLLFDHPARDPVVFGGVACVLLAVAAAASLVPAFRANRVDPLEALRAE